MKKLSIFLLTLMAGLGLWAQEYKPVIPTVDDYYREFSQQKAWDVRCVKGMQVDTGLVVDALLLEAQSGEGWDLLLTRFHINLYQMHNSQGSGFHMGWARTWRRDLKKDAFKKTPAEHACLTFFSPKTATVLVLFPASTADEERLLGFFLKKYENQAPRRLRRVEVVRDPTMPLGFRHVWLAPIVNYASSFYYYIKPSKPSEKAE